MKKIMIVDDEAFIRKILGKELVSLGYEVSYSVDGIECLDTLTELIKFNNLNTNLKGILDLIILDVMMPRLDGYETCCRIRKELKLSLPVVFLSSNALKSSIVKAIQSGGNEYIVKSPDSSKLIQRIEELINDF